VVILKPSQQSAAARIGRAAECLVAAWFLLRHPVWVSIMPDASSIDMLVMQQADNTRTIRVQVKAAYISKRSNKLVVNLTKSDGSKYTSADVDFVLAVDVERQMFWVLPIVLASKFGRVNLNNRFSGYQHDWFDSNPLFNK